MQAKLFYACSCRLGEGAFWHPQEQKLYFIDIEGRQLHRIDPGDMSHQSWALPSRPGTVVAASSGGLLLALEGEVRRFDPETGAMAPWLSLAGEPAGNRSNDGKCDPAGRFWLGTMSLEETPHAGRLYCILPGGELRPVLERRSVSNGLAWTADRSRMYYIDSPTRCIAEYAYDDRSGSIRFLGNAVQVPEELGFPDGMAIDEADRLWVAHWDGFAVCCWDPRSGQLLERIELPVPQVTSCTFGGADMRTLYITTAWKGMSAEQRARYPLSGHVFCARTGLAGRASHPFAG